MAGGRQIPPRRCGTPSPLSVRFVQTYGGSKPPPYNGYANNSDVPVGEGLANDLTNLGSPYSLHPHAGGLYVWCSKIVYRM